MCYKKADAPAKKRWKEGSPGTQGHNSKYVEFDGQLAVALATYYHAKERESWEYQKEEIKEEKGRGDVKLGEKHKNNASCEEHSLSFLSRTGMS